MGNFYTNITVDGPDRAALADYLTASRRTAYLSPTAARKTVVFERNLLEMAMGGEEWGGDEPDGDEPTSELAADLSRAFSCPALAVMVHDDDILSYELFRDGTLVDHYNSSPDYFGAGAGPLGSSPEGGDARQLCAAFGAEDAAERVGKILRKSGNSANPDAYVFESERHGDLVRALGLPDCAVATGYHYIAQGESEYDPERWVKIGD